MESICRKLNYLTVDIDTMIWRFILLRFYVTLCSISDCLGFYFCLTCKKKEATQSWWSETYIRCFQSLKAQGLRTQSSEPIILFNFLLQMYLYLELLIILLIRIILLSRLFSIESFKWSILNRTQISVLILLQNLIQQEKNLNIPWLLRLVT